MEGLTLKAMLEGGVLIGLAMALILVFVLVIKHVLNSQVKILDMATSQNAGWQKVIGEHTEQAKSFHDKQDEAHRYQRDEHRELSNKVNEQAALTNGMFKLMEQMSRNLDEQGKVLLRINGERH